MLYAWEHIGTKLVSRTLEELDPVGDFSRQPSRMQLGFATGHFVRRVTRRYGVTVGEIVRRMWANKIT